MAKVKAHFWSQGSALAGTLQAGCNGFEVNLEIKSSAPAEEVSRLVRISENTCYVMQTLANPVPVVTTVALNGQPLAVATDR